MSDKEYELLSKGMVIAWDEGLMTREEMERALAYLDALATAEQRATDAEATLATIGGADKATLARKLRRANAATRDAEQRAERLAAAMRNAEDAISRRSSDYALRILDAALTAPATQPDERATEAHHARIAHVGAAVAAQCAAKEGT